MPRLYLLDPSFLDLGGHHYDYNLQVLLAAEGAGWRPILAPHAGFRAHDHLPEHWTVVPAFHHHVYSKYSILFGRSERPVNPFLPSPGSARERLSGLRTRFSQVRRARRFARSCRRVFDRHPPEAGDRVFLPTISEFELVGLAEFLRSHPQARVADWHVQFHFPFLEGRESDFDRQAERVAALRAHVAHLLKLIPGVRLHFHTTTPQLAAQYDRLGVAKFHALPYPVNPSVADPVPLPAGGPVRVVCAGGLREEKGAHHLGEIVADLARDGFANGRLQVWVQAERAEQVPRGDGPPPAAGDPRDPAAAQGPLVHVPHPLPLDEYVRLIRSADVGLFLYDARRYYARCSAVLVELLTAGVPVVVPGGCWLGDELIEADADHIERMARELRRMGGAKIEATKHLRCGGKGEPAVLGLAPPPGAAELLAGFRWTASPPEGRYARIDCHSMDGGGKTLDRASAVTRPRGGGRPSLALFHLPPGAHRVELAWSNAFDSGRLDFHDVEPRFLAADGYLGGHCPLGRVGLIASDVARIPALLRDIAAHYDHYRASAKEFAVEYLRQHHPLQVLRGLEAA